MAIFFTYQINAQFYTVNFKKHKSEIKPINLYIDSVIDASKDKICIGYVFKGMSLTPTLARFENSIIDQFKTLINQKDRKGNFEHVILRINRFYISEAYDGSVAYIMLNISFIIKQGNEYFEKYQASVTLHEKSMNANNLHADNIIRAINLCFQQYENRKLNLNDASQLIKTSLSDNPINNQIYRINTVSDYPRGLYHNFSDFRDCTTDTKMNFSLENKAKNDNVEYVIKNLNDSIVSKIWGFSDGKHTYMNIGNRFYPIQKDNNRLYIYQMPQYQYMSSSYGGLTAGEMGGGALGVAISTIGAHKLQFNIDLTSGMIIQQNYIDDFEVDAKVVICISKNGEAAKDIELYVNGTKACLMDDGTYYVIRCGREMKNVDFCLKYKGNQLCEHLKPTLFMKELYVVTIKNNKLRFEPNTIDVEKEAYKQIEVGEFSKIEEAKN